MSDKVKEYWDERAAQFAKSPAATTNDVYLRELEIATLVRVIVELKIAAPGPVLDVGCGNGYSTLRVARELPSLEFTGVDFSENMVEAAQALLAGSPELAPRVSFRVGSVLDLTAACGEQLFAATMTDRCLINLLAAEDQTRAIAQIAARTRPSGWYIAIENFVEGQERMNAARRTMGLEDIPVRWHNRYLVEAEFLKAAEPFFDKVHWYDFSSAYYLATRVAYSAMCKMRGEEPNYEHEMHRRAVNLPWGGQFSPIRMAGLRRRTA